MRRLVVGIVLAALCGAGCGTAREATTSEAPADPPPGTYQLTCGQIALGNDDVLTAVCEKLDGSPQPASLADVERCLASIVNRGDIGNIDGNLMCIPDLPVTSAGIVFPEAESTINGWIYGGELQPVLAHAWGIWAGLTQQVGEIDGTPVRAFETWATPSNMIFRIRSGAGAEAVGEPQRRLELMTPRQHNNQAPAPPEATEGSPNPQPLVSIAYNPPAAAHAVSNRLFLQSTLDDYLARGYKQIPAFPNNAITIKPVFNLVPRSPEGGIFAMPGWPGTPSPARAFAPDQWDACIYLNVTATGTGGSAIDPGCASAGEANTFFLDNFIHHAISEADADFLSQQLAVPVSPGDYAVLVGMHVTSRETLRWTWQTFWWSASPDAPRLPSSSAIAAARPLGALDEASAHYAMAHAYQMVGPAQPVDGGDNVGAAVIGYNPHLEAGFDRSTFQILRPINAGTPNQIDNDYGVQTNCMTCHGLAFYDPSVNYAPVPPGTPDPRQQPYGTDFYVARDDGVFAGKLQLEFAWSILGSMVLDGEQ